MGPFTSEQWLVMKAKARGEHWKWSLETYQSGGGNYVTRREDGMGPDSAARAIGRTSRMESVTIWFD